MNTRNRTEFSTYIKNIRLLLSSSQPSLPANLLSTTLQVLSLQTLRLSFLPVGCLLSHLLPLLLSSISATQAPPQPVPILARPYLLFLSKIAISEIFDFSVFFVFLAFFDYFAESEFQAFRDEIVATICKDRVYRKVYREVWMG